MKLLLPFIAGVSLLIPQIASADPKDKDKKVPPGQARKAAASQAQVQQVQRSSNGARSTATREYVAPTRSTTTRSYAEPTRSTTTRNYVAPNVSSTATRSTNYDTNRRYTTSSRDGDRYRSSSYDSGDRHYSSNYRYYHPDSNVYRHWDRGRVYSWNNHRYHWHGGSWVIFDVAPSVVYTEREVGGSVVADVQAELRRRGYDAGPADGVMGGRTRSAILDFQADHGLSRTGRINESLLRALNLA